MISFFLVKSHGVRYMKDKKVVVTGGAGFIGSNLTEVLMQSNDVIVIDNLSTGHRENIQKMIDDKNITFINGDITDLNLLRRTFKDIDYVFHEAAIPSVPRSVNDPISSNYANVNGTLNVLVAAKDNGIEKVVYASSSSVFGDTPTLPKKENMKPCPLSPYAVGKLTGEYYCQVFTDVYGLSTNSLRYFNVYGPRQDPLSEYAAVIPKFITRVLNEKSPIIYGNGEQTRDFTYIDDVVAMNIQAAESKVTGIFNTANGNQVTINVLAKLIMEIIGKDFDPIYNNFRPGDIKHSLADISKAREKLRYEPRFTLTKGLQETVKWFQNQI